MTNTNARLETTRNQDTNKARISIQSTQESVRILKNPGERDTRLGMEMVV